jgi:hypothetical protein
LASSSYRPPRRSSGRASARAASIPHAGCTRISTPPGTPPSPRRGYPLIIIGMIGLLLDGTTRLFERLKTVRWRYVR